MAATIDLVAHPDRYGRHRMWDAEGTTYDTGTLQTARHSWWLFRDGVLVNQNHTGPLFSHVFEESDDGIDFELFYQTLEEGAGSVTEDSISWTHSVVGWNRTYYVDTAGSDSNDGLSTGAPKATVGSAVTAANSWWSGTQNVRILLKRGQSHAYNSSLEFPGARSGRWGLGAYDSGARPIITKTSDGQIATVGTAFSDTDHTTIHIEDVDIEGSSASNVQPLVHLAITNSATSTSASVLFRNMTITQVGGLVETVQYTAPSTAQADDGRCEFIAIENVAATDTNWYTVRFGGGWLPRYIHLEGCSSITNPSGSSGTYARWYNTKQTWIRDLLIGDHAADGFRMLSTGSDATYHTQWLNASGVASYDGPYTFHNIASEGSSPSDEINEQRDQWFHSCRCNSIGGSGQSISITGVCHRISVRACWVNGGSVSVANDAVAANNETLNHFWYECNTTYQPSTAGGNTIALAFFDYDSGSTASNWNVNNNFIGVVSASGDPVFGGAGSGLGSVLNSSDYNVAVMPTGRHMVWYTGHTSGGVSLATWQGATAFDDNSVDDVGTIGITDAGTLGTADDYDFRLQAGSTAVDAGGVFPGADIDFDSNLRVTTHDAGASDRAATDPPEAPGADEDLTASLTGSMTMTAALTAVGALTCGISGSVTQTGAIGGVGALTASMAASLMMVPIDPGLTGVGALSGQMSASLTNTSSLTGTGELACAHAGSLTMTGSLTGDGEGILNCAMAASLQMSASLTGQGDLAAAFGASLTQAAGLTGTGHLSAVHTGSLTMGSTLTGQGVEDLSCSMQASLAMAASLTGVGDLVAAGQLAGTLTASLVGAMDLTCTMTASGQMSAAMSGVGALQPVFGATMTSTGALTGTGHLECQMGAILAMTAGFGDLSCAMAASLTMGADLSGVAVIPTDPIPATGSLLGDWLRRRRPWWRDRRPWWR